jgi:phosphoribosylformylglycinamidine synthase
VACRERLVSRLGNGVSTLSGRYVHYVHFFEDVTVDEEEEEEERLQRILSYGEDFTQSPLSNGLHRHILYVYPRPATISPWSSQATEISHTSGLSKTIKRIERGIVFAIDSARELSDKILRSQELYDRMTQCLTADPPSLDVMFAEHAPQPLRVIQTQEPGIDAKEVIRAANKDLGLALEEQDIEYLASALSKGGKIGRNPTDVELYTFAQVSSSRSRRIRAYFRRSIVNIVVIVSSTRSLS